MFEEYDSDPILLMLDNTSKTFETVVKIVVENPNDLRDYITHWAAEDLRSVGDRIQATELEKALRSLREACRTNPEKVERYWRGLVKHYKRVAEEVAA